VGGVSHSSRHNNKKTNKNSKKLTNAWSCDRKREKIQEERVAADHGGKDEKGV